MQLLKKLLFSVSTAFIVSACQTIPHSEIVASTVEDYALESDRHIVAMGTAWNACYHAYNALAKTTDRRFEIAKDAAVAMILVTDTDDTGISDREALRIALQAVIEQNLIDKLRVIDEPFKSYLDEVVNDSNLNPMIKGIVNRLLAPAQAGQNEADRRAAVIEDVIAYMFDAGAAARANCTGAAFAEFEADFYDDWSSKLFAVQEMAKADDALGLCSKVAGLVKEHADRINDAILKTRFKALSFSTGTECSLATIGGVLTQHENLRNAHSDLVVLDRDTGLFWRKTIAQSVRIARTVEKFKKSASEDSGDLF